jgi:hypothetical protein
MVKTKKWRIIMSPPVPNIPIAMSSDLILELVSRTSGWEGLEWSTRFVGTSGEVILVSKLIEDPGIAARITECLNRALFLAKKDEISVISSVREPLKLRVCVQISNVNVQGALSAFAVKFIRAHSSLGAAV